MCRIEKLNLELEKLKQDKLFLKNVLKQLVKLNHKYLSNYDNKNFEIRNVANKFSSNRFVSKVNTYWFVNIICLVLFSTYVNITNVMLAHDSTIIFISQFCIFLLLSLCVVCVFFLVDTLLLFRRFNTKLLIKLINYASIRIKKFLPHNFGLRLLAVFLSVLFLSFFVQLDKYYDRNIYYTFIVVFFCFFILAFFNYFYSLALVMQRYNQNKNYYSFKYYFIKSMKFAFLVLKNDVKCAVKAGIFPSLTLIGFVILFTDRSVWNELYILFVKQNIRGDIVFIVISLFIALILIFLIPSIVFQSLRSYDSKWEYCTQKEKLASLTQISFVVLTFTIMSILSERENINLECIVFSFFIIFTYIFYVIISLGFTLEKRYRRQNAELIRIYSEIKLLTK